MSKKASSKTKKSVKIETAPVKSESKTVKSEIKSEVEDDKSKVVTVSSNKLRTGSPILRIITGSYEHNVMCISLALHKSSEIFTPVFHFQAHSQSIRCLAINKRYLASGSNDEHIRVYDIQRRKELGNLIHHSGSITVLQFYKNWLFSAADDGRICIWKTRDWEPLAEMKGHKGPINDLSIHPSGKIGISVGKDKTLRLWNLMTAKKASILKLRGEAYQASWLPDGEHYVAGFDRKFEIFHKGDSIGSISLPSSLQHMRIVNILGQDEPYLVLSLGNGKILFYSVSTLTDKSLYKETSPVQVAPSFELVGHATRVKSFSTLDIENTTLMTSISSDGKIVVWDLMAKDQIAVYMSGDRLNCCVVMPDSGEQLLKRPRTEQDDEDEAQESADEAENVDKTPSNKKIKQEVDIILEN